MEKILFAIPNNQELFESMYEELNTEYLLFDNAATQEKIYDLMHHNNPEYLILDKTVPGTRDYEDFVLVITNNFPGLTIILWQDNPEEIVGMLKGQITIPEFQLPQIFVSEDEIELDEEADEINWLDERKQKEWEKVSKSNVELYDNMHVSLAVSGFSGGIGKTEVAINFACWASKNDYKVALLGFNLQNDDIQERLGIEKQRGKGLVAAHELFLVNELNFSSLMDVMSKENEFLSVLTGIRNTEESEYMTEDFFKEIIQILKPEFDLVIVDTENNSYSPAYLPVLQEVDNILVPCTTHVSHLIQVQKGIINLKDRYDIPLSKFDIVLNKEGEGGVVDQDLINKNTGRECVASVPYLKEVFKAAENEKPAVLKLKPSKKLTRAMDQLMFRYTGRMKKSGDGVKPFYLRFRKEVKASAKRVKEINKSS